MPAATLLNSCVGEVCNVPFIFRVRLGRGRINSSCDQMLSALCSVYIYLCFAVGFVAVTGIGAVGVYLAVNPPIRRQMYAHVKTVYKIAEMTASMKNKFSGGTTSPQDQKVSPTTHRVVMQPVKKTL